MVTQVTRVLLPLAAQGVTSERMRECENAGMSKSHTVKTCQKGCNIGINVEKKNGKILK